MPQVLQGLRLDLVKACRPVVCVWYCAPSVNVHLVGVQTGHSCAVLFLILEIVQVHVAGQLVCHKFWLSHKHCSLVCPTSGYVPLLVAAT